MINQYDSNAAILKEFGKRLRKYRIGLFYTQESFAGQSGLSIRTISNIENGKDASFENIIRFLKALNLTTNLNLLVPTPNDEANDISKKRYKKSTESSTWKWGDEK